MERPTERDPSNTRTHRELCDDVFAATFESEPPTDGQVAAWSISPHRYWLSRFLGTGEQTRPFIFAEAGDFQGYILYRMRLSESEPTKCHTSIYLIGHEEGLTSALHYKVPLPGYMTEENLDAIRSAYEFEKSNNLVVPAADDYIAVEEALNGAISDGALRFVRPDAR